MKTSSSLDSFTEREAVINENTRREEASDSILPRHTK